MLGSTNFQKPQLLSQLVHPFLLLNFYLPRYSYLSLVFRAVIFMFHPFSGISHSRKKKLVPRNFPLENGRKSPGNEIGGVWEIRELKKRRRRRQRERQKRNRFRWCTCITLFCTFICLHSTTRRKNAYFHKTLFLFLNYDSVLKNWTPEEFANIWRIERDKRSSKKHDAACFYSV